MVRPMEMCLGASWIPCHRYLEYLLCTGALSRSSSNGLLCRVNPIDSSSFSFVNSIDVLAEIFGKSTASTLEDCSNVPIGIDESWGAVGFVDPPQWIRIGLKAINWFVQKNRIGEEESFILKDTLTWKPVTRPVHSHGLLLSRCDPVHSHGSFVFFCCSCDPVHSHGSFFVSIGMQPMPPLSPSASIRRCRSFLACSRNLDHSLWSTTNVAILDLLSYIFLRYQHCPILSLAPSTRLARSSL